jgi:uncharacterized protein
LSDGENAIVVIVRKFDGAEHRRWSARLVDRSGSLITLDATFEEQIEHDLLGPIPLGTISTEYYWLDRWYNVFRFCDPQRRLRRFYCNINMPPHFDGKVLSYVDLDIDVLVEPNLSYRILDLEDFEENSKRYSYPVEVQNVARVALDELVRLIESRSFPFSDT